MLPYSSSHHLISQEATPPNPTFPMPLDQHYEQLFSGHQFSSGTLEAVLRPPAVARDATAAVAAMAPAVARNSRGGARKRPFRTDRHSKIRTAQGVRDRRMRLSLDVARDFFALQDRLGFDKASKTVDWLLTQSKPAIDRLSASLHRDGGGDLPSTELAGRPVNEAVAAGSGKREVDEVKVRGRSDGSVLVEHGCELDRPVSAAAEAEAFDQPVEYYYDYDLGELMSNNGGEGDDDGNDDEGDDFLDGMQY